MGGARREHYVRRAVSTAAVLTRITVRASLRLELVVDDGGERA